MLFFVLFICLDSHQVAVQSLLFTLFFAFVMGARFSSWFYSAAVTDLDPSTLLPMTFGFRVVDPSASSPAPLFVSMFELGRHNAHMLLVVVKCIHKV